MEPALVRRRSFGLTKAASYIFTALALLTLLGLVVLFVMQSLPVWPHEGLRYITGAKWYFRAHTFGALPMIYGSVVVSVVALALATPLGMGAAVFTRGVSSPGSHGWL